MLPALLYVLLLLYRFPECGMNQCILLFLHSCSFTEEIQSPECNRAAAAVSQQQLPLYKESHPAVPHIGADARPERRTTPPHSRRSTPHQENTSKSSEIPSWNPSAVPQHHQPRTGVFALVCYQGGLGGLFRHGLPAS